MKISALAVCVAALALSLPQPPMTNAAAQKIVTAAQVNGTWRTQSGEFKIWALGNQRLQVEFSGSYEYESQGGPMANVGTGSGIARIDGDTASFRPDGVDEDCLIRMKFTRGKLVVTQDGGCGFGHNVSANGTYKKVSSSKPKFS
jgi:hypothetical protein